MVLDPLLPPQTSPRLFRFLPSRSDSAISEIPLILTSIPPWLAWERSQIVPRKACGMGLCLLTAAGIHPPLPLSRSSPAGRAAPPQAFRPVHPYFCLWDCSALLSAELSEVNLSPGMPMPTPHGGETGPESPETEPTRPKPWQMGAS